MPGVLWDEWSAFEHHIEASKPESPRDKEAAPPLVVAGLFHKWHPAAMHVAELLDELRDSGSTDFASIYTLEVHNDAAYDIMRQYDVLSTPALLFYWEGHRMTVRRNGFSDSNVFVGPIDREQLLEMIQHAKEQGRRGKYYVLNG